MEGDVLLADHFDDYGSNGDWYRYERELRDHIKANFDRVWTWG